MINRGVKYWKVLMSVVKDWSEKESQRRTSRVWWIHTYT